MESNIYLGNRGNGGLQNIFTSLQHCTISMINGSCWMFDCGEGSQVQLMRSSVRPGKISKIFISHLHGDHVFGLPGLLCTISQNYSPESKAQVEIYGPTGLRRFLRESLGLSRSRLGYNYIVHELKPTREQYPTDWEKWPVDHEDSGPCHPSEQPGRCIEADPDRVWTLCSDGGTKVTAGCLDHWVPSFGFVIQEEALPGRLDADRLKALGIPPGPLYAKIKKGESIQTPDGNMVSPSDVLGPPRPGRKVCILGDSSNSDKMATACDGADVIVHEATLANDMEANALEKGHSTPRMAGKFARDVSAKLLVLTHFSQRYRPASADLKEGEESVDILLEQAKVSFGSDNVVAVEDLMTVPVPPRPCQGS